MNPLSLLGEKCIINNASAKKNGPHYKLLFFFLFLFQVFLVKAQTPTITGLSSNICAGGSITITGTNFVGITAANVEIGTTLVSSITSFTGTQIIAVVNAACTGNVKVTTSHGTATSTGPFTCYAIPVAPTVITPLNYCLNATSSQLTATGSNLTWGGRGGSVSGSVGGTSTLSTQVYIDNTYSNKMTNFTTTVPNVTITNIDYYIPSWQAVTGMVLAIYNSSGTVIATSSTTTTLTAGSSTVKISNSFSYTISTAGNYSVGIYAGLGNIGYDNPSFPITESTGTVNITGVSVSGYRCFNNIEFTVNSSSSIAPTPSTSSTGTTDYLVSQTVSGCVSPEATIAVIVNAAPSATILYSGSPFCKSVGSAQSVTLTGTGGGSYSASPTGLSINASTGTITPSLSTAGSYTVTYTMAASGGCSMQTTTTSVTINATPAAPTVTTPVKYCLNAVASQLTATGSNLTWGGTSSISGSVGGTTPLTTVTYIDNTYNNKKTNFTTTVPNVTITNIDYYIPSNQAVSGMVVAIYNSSGTAIATSSTTTTLNAGASAVKISNSFSYTIPAAGNYSVGVYAGSGNIGSDNPSFPITEPTGTINITGVSVSGARCFNNIAFTVDNGSTAPTPSTSVADTTNYMVSQTVNGCVSPQATIAVIVNPLSVGGTVNSNATVCTGTNSGTVYLSGQTGSVVKWQYSIDGGTSWSDITNVTDSETYSNLAQTTIGRAVVQSGVCASANSSPDTITVVAPGSWIGTVSTDWNDSRNWLCGQIPTSAINVSIPGGASYYPVVSSGIDTAKNITIASGGSLTVGSGTLQIFGSIANSGTLDATNGTLEMKGAGAQTLDGSAFYKRTINNLIVSNTGSGLSVSSTANDTLKITGTLTFGNSGSTLNTGDNITLVSNSAGTASLGIVGSGNTITGQVVVERYINIGTVAGQHAKSWQFLATPTVGQTVKQSWMENGITTSTGYGTMVTGAGGTAAGFDVYTASPSLKYFVPSTDSWTGIANTNIPIYNPNGYLVFVRGDRSVTAYNQPPNNTILRTKGTLLTGTQSPLSVTPNEYGSIGNPYPSPVDFTLITKGNGIDDLFYVWDPYLYGSYGYGGYQTLSSANEWKPVPGGTSAYPTGTPYYILQSGQAIFVHATSILPYNASDYNLTFSEDDKSSSSSTNVSRVNGLAPTVNHESLNVSLYTGNIIADGNTVVFDRSYSDNVDGNDALKILNQGENFGLLRNGKLLAIEARAPASVSDTLYYDMSNLSITSYQLRFAPENMSSTGLQAYLIDNFLNTATPVSLTDSSSVNISITSNPASYAYNRFDVVFRTLTAMPVTFTSITAVQKNTNIEVDWKVENESGIQQYEVEESADGSQFTQEATVAVNTNGSGNYSWLDENATPGYHYYRVRSVGKDGQIQYTDIVKVLIGNPDASISVYPNPVVNDDIHLQFNNQPAGVYGIRLLNTLGQLIVSKVINHSDGSSSEDLSPDHKLPKGVYQVEVTKPDGTVEVVKVVN